MELREFVKKEIEYWERAKRRIVITDEFEYPHPFRPHNTQRISNDFASLIEECKELHEGVLVIGYDQLSQDKSICDILNSMMYLIGRYESEEFLVCISVPSDEIYELTDTVDGIADWEIGCMEELERMAEDDGFLLRIRDRRGLCLYRYAKIYEDGTIHIVVEKRNKSFIRSDHKISPGLLEQVKEFVYHYRDEYYKTTHIPHEDDRGSEHCFFMDVGQKWLGLDPHEYLFEWDSFPHPEDKVYVIRKILSLEYMKEFVDTEDQKEYQRIRQEYSRKIQEEWQRHRKRKG